jgi:hypothetical protein
VKGFIIAAWMLLAPLAHAQTVPVDAVSNIKAKITKCVVRVQTPLSGGAIAFGSGVAVRHADLPFIVTNHHVIADSVGPVLVCRVGGKWTAARVIATDPKFDLAILDQANLTEGVANTGRYDASHTYTLAGFADHGRLHFHHLWRGSFVFLDGDMKKSIVEFHGSSCHGDSGGPIFNARGEVCGITCGKDETPSRDGGNVDGIMDGPLLAILKKAAEAN